MKEKKEGSKLGIGLHLLSPEDLLYSFGC